MPHKPKPTTTPALIDKAKKCTSAKEVIQTLFTTKHIPNPVERAEAKKIFLKEGIPWPSARGRKRKGEFVVKKVKETKGKRQIVSGQQNITLTVSKNLDLDKLKADCADAIKKAHSELLRNEQTDHEWEKLIGIKTETVMAEGPPLDVIPRSPVAFCPACGSPLALSTIIICPGCGKGLDIEIHTRTIYTITAK
jgi:hypothetical protein